MNRFSLCQALAASIVSRYRALCPPGFDPQNAVTLNGTTTPSTDQNYFEQPLESLRFNRMIRLCAVDGLADSSNDLTDPTNNDSMIFQFPIPASATLNYVLLGGILLLTTPFQNTADGAFNSTTVQIGDSTSTTSLLAATQINYNGAYVQIAPLNPLLGTALTQDASVDNTTGTAPTPSTGTITYAAISSTGTAANAIAGVIAELAKVKADLATLKANTTGGGKIYSAADNILVQVNSMSGKPLSALNQGRLHIYLDLRAINPNSLG